MIELVATLIHVLGLPELLGMVIKNAGHHAVKDVVDHWQVAEDAADIAAAAKFSGE